MSEKRCIHGRRKRQCRNCGGSSTCPHASQKLHCLVCRPDRACDHGRIAKDCKECGGFDTLAKQLLSAASGRSRAINVPFDLTAEHVRGLIGTGVCPVFQIPFDLSARYISDYSASIDRFKPELGYVQGNCRVISALANRIKTTATATQIQQVLNWMTLCKE